jgi:hypothetical protein
MNETEVYKVVLQALLHDGSTGTNCITGRSWYVSTMSACELAKVIAEKICSPSGTLETKSR